MGCRGRRKRPRIPFTRSQRSRQRGAVSEQPGGLVCPATQTSNERGDPDVSADQSQILKRTASQFWGFVTVVGPEISLSKAATASALLPWPQRTYRRHALPCCRFIAICCEPETSSVSMAFVNMPFDALETHFESINQKPILNGCRSSSTRALMNYR